MTKTILVFESNLAGNHSKGTALEARQYWGARQGVSSGFEGCSYAIPTRGRNLDVLPIADIETSILRLIAFIGSCELGKKGYKFKITKIGEELPSPVAMRIRDVLATAIKYKSVQFAVKQLEEEVTIKVPEEVVLPLPVKNPDVPKKVKLSRKEGCAIREAKKKDKSKEILSYHEAGLNHVEIADIVNLSPKWTKKIIMREINEKRIVKLLKLGLKQCEIAEELGIAKSTLRFLCREMRAKGVEL